LSTRVLLLPPATPELNLRDNWEGQMSFLSADYQRQNTKGSSNWWVDDPNQRELAAGLIISDPDPQGKGADVFISCQSCTQTVLSMNKTEVTLKYW